MTGSLSPFVLQLVFVSLCLTYEIGISSFSLLAGIFESGQYRLAYRCVRSFDYFIVVQFTPPAFCLHHFWLFFVCVCGGGSVLFRAWMRTAILAGGIAVVRSGFLCDLLKMVTWLLLFVHWRLDC